MESHDNNKKKNSAFIISRNSCKKLAEHRLRTSAVDARVIGNILLSISYFDDEPSRIDYSVISRRIEDSLATSKQRLFAGRIFMKEFEGSGRSTLKYTLTGDQVCLFYRPD